MCDSVRLRAEILKKILAHAQRDPHVECCGVLAGPNDAITAIFPARNALDSATAYEIEPEELFRIFHAMRKEGLAHLGLYHSHPRGENVPSPTDVEQAYYPDQVYFIVSPQPNAPKPLRAFSIRDGAARELEIVVTNP